MHLISHLLIFILILPIWHLWVPSRHYSTFTCVRWWLESSSGHVCARLLLHQWATLLACKSTLHGNISYILVACLAIVLSHTYAGKNTIFKWVTLPGKFIPLWTLWSTYYVLGAVVGPFVRVMSMANGLSGSQRLWQIIINTA